MQSPANETLVEEMLDIIANDSENLERTMKKWAAVLAIVLLGADIIGRVALVVTGLYPTNSFKNTFSIIAGTAIAAIFAIYIRSKWRIFR